MLLNYNGNFFFTEEIHLEIAAQVLLTSIRHVRKNEFFSLLNKCSQDECLKKIWGALFMLHTANWPVDISIFGIFRNFCSTILHVRSLKLLTVEIQLLEAIISCRPGKYFKLELNACY